MLRRASAVALLFLFRSSAARADDPPAAPPPPAVPPVVSTPAAPPVAPAPPPVAVSASSATAPPAAQKPASDEEAEQPVRSSFGLGAAYFGSHGSGRTLDRFGLMLEGGGVFPVHRRWGMGLRFSWGLTEFERFEKWTQAGYSIGKWTTTAYGDVYEWSAQKDKYQTARVMGSLFAYIGLFFPLAVAGVCYLGAVFAPTTYMETALTVNYDFGNRRFGPYIEGGVAMVGFVHPTHISLRGGIGPTLGSGLRLGPFRVGGHVAWLPPSLHGEPTEHGSTHVFTGAMTLGFGN